MSVDVCLICFKPVNRLKRVIGQARLCQKPHEIRAALDQYVIGQDIAKNPVCCRYNHYKRLKVGQSHHAPQDVEIAKVIFY